MNDANTIAVASDDLRLSVSRQLSSAKAYYRSLDLYRNQDLTLETRPQWLKETWSSDTAGYFLDSSVRFS